MYILNVLISSYWEIDIPSECYPFSFETRKGMNVGKWKYWQIKDEIFATLYYFIDNGFN